MQTEENTLAWYMRQAARVPLLTPEQELEYSTKAKTGCMKSRDRMIEGNLRLVLKVAMHFQGRGLDVMDLISEGNLGLIKAIERYDPTSGYKFSTYAVWWIRERVSRSIIQKSSVVRIPDSMYQDQGKLKKAIDALQEKEDGQPTIAALAHELNWPAWKVQKRMKLLAQGTVNIEDAMTDDSAADFHEVMVDENIPDPSDILEIMSDNDIIAHMLDKLDTRERTVIVHRYGMNCDTKSLEDIGSMVGMTREGVRQVQRRALDKMRRWAERC